MHMVPVKQWVPWAQLSMSKHVRIGTGWGRGRRGRRGGGDGNMPSAVHRMDMSNLGATHEHLGTPSSPRRLPLGVSLPSLPCSRDSHAFSRFQQALRPGLPAVQQTSVDLWFPSTLPLPFPCASPACSPCLALLVLGCQELFFALPCLLMLGLPCILPFPLPCSFVSSLFS